MSNYTMSPVVNGEKKQMIVKVGDTQPIGTIVDYDGNTIPNGWQQVENVLWENSSPTTAIENGAEFSLSSSDYDYYSIIYNLSTSGTNISFNTEKIPKGQGTVLSIITSGASSFNGLQRNINHTSDTKLTSGVPYSFNNSSRSIDNTALIPTKIIGYKKQIKKIAPVTPANGNIKNSYGTSQTDTYSQEYINDKTYEIVTGNGWTMKKYGDGTMIGYKAQNFSNVIINTAWGNLYSSSNLTFDAYPVPFIDVPTTTITQTGASSCFVMNWESTLNTATQLGGFRVVRPDSSTNNRNIVLSAIAIGRWK